MKHPLLFAIVVTCLISFDWVSAREAYPHNAGANNQSKSLGGDSIYQLNSVWTDQDGKSIALGSFRGKPLVLAMIYTSCQDACPLIVSEMQKIESTLPEPVREQVRFALFSFDSERDTPAQLKRYASAHDLDPKRWTLLTGSADSVRLLAAVLGVRYKRDLNGDFSHSSVITVLDSGGEIRHQQTGLRKDPGEVATVINGLLTPKK